MEQCMNNLRDKLNEVCRKNGEAQKRLSDKCGISTRELRRIMYGEVWDIRLSTFIRLSEELGILEVWYDQERHSA